LQEQQALASLPEEQQCLAFFTCWTRKEAYIKAIGDGLAMALDEFTVSIRPGEPAALLSNQAKPSEPSRWKMQPIEVGPDYMATLVGEGQDWEMIFDSTEKRLTTDS
jgi:4'-phosphopantetheinyl transferase